MTPAKQAREQAEAEVAQIEESILRSEAHRHGFFLQDKGYVVGARTAVAAVEKVRFFMEECEAEVARAGASAPSWFAPVYMQAVEDI